jgi:hypothetical protein
VHYRDDPKIGAFRAIDGKVLVNVLLVGFHLRGLSGGVTQDNLAQPTDEGTLISSHQQADQGNSPINRTRQFILVSLLEKNLFPLIFALWTVTQGCKSWGVTDWGKVGPRNREVYL